MNSNQSLRALLSSLPAPSPSGSAGDCGLIEDSVRYLASDAASRSIADDVYWPKWNSPWWHMLLLHEMGETKRIPQSAIERMVQGLRQSPLKSFPIEPEDLPPDIDPLITHCHCALGSIYQVLAAWGVNVDEELPWIRPWFLRYQMADGGLSCDNEAYRVKGECPSSMVGTIAPFEAVLLYTPRAWTEAEATFLTRVARFLIERQLVRGSQTVHNQEERAKQADWLKPCFPRFYFYDVLRGLQALVLWAEKTGQALPVGAIEPAVTYLAQRFPDGVIGKERRCYESVTTRLQSTKGVWTRHHPASLFPLLDEVSALGRESPYLTLQWSECRKRIQNLLESPRPSP